MNYTIDYSDGSGSPMASLAAAVLNLIMVFGPLILIMAIVGFICGFLDEILSGIEFPAVPAIPGDDACPGIPAAMA